MPQPNKFQLRIGDVQYSVSISEEAYGLYNVKVDNETFRISIADLLLPPSPKGSAKPGASKAIGQSEAIGAPRGEGGGAVKAAMPGTVMTIKMKVGDTVKQGDVLLTLETMKMENPIKSTRAGKIREISVQPGKFVNVGDMLMVID